MLNKKTVLKIDGKEYELMFNFNMLEKVQEKYGTYSDFLKSLYKDEEVLPDIKELKWALLHMINEGIKFSNFENNEKTELADDGFIDYIMAKKKPARIVVLINEAFTKFNAEIQEDGTSEDEDEKN